MFKLLLFSVLFITLVVGNGNCDFSSIELIIKDIKFDSDALGNCESLKKLLYNCTDDNGSKKLSLLNQILYKQGLIELSLGHDLKALDYFNEAMEANSNDAYSTLSKERAEKMNIQFGLWNKVSVERNQTRDRYLFLDGMIVHLLKNDIENDKLESYIREASIISPFNLNLKYKHIDYQLYQLSKTFDVAIAFDIMKSFQFILEKHNSNLSLNRRLSIHYNISIIQMFLLTTEPTNLRRCLAIDMDYQPCKKLSLLQSRLNKINPHRTSVLDPDIYKFLNTDNAQDIDWNKLVTFYLTEKKPCMRMSAGDHFTNNYGLIDNAVTEAIENLLKSSSLHYQKPTKKADFMNFIDTILCQASTEVHNHKKLTGSFCKKALKNVLNTDQWKLFQGAIMKGEAYPIDELRNLWNSYPHLAMYLIDTIMKKGSKTSQNIQEEVSRFYNDNNIRDATNPYIRRQLDSMEKINQENKSRQQQQQQQQQHDWFFNQQHQQRQQNQQRQQHHQPPSQAHSDKDYYNIMDLSSDASPKDIRRKYLDLTKKYHPDKQGQLSEEEQKRNCLFIHI